jgi:hypothetical protein
MQRPRFDPAGLRVPAGTYRVAATVGRQEAAPTHLRVLP